MISSPPLWRLAARSIFLWVGLLFSALGLLFLGIGVASALEEGTFASQARTVEATVVGRSIRKADFDTHPSTRYLVRYRLAPPGGAAVVESREVPVEEWERSEPGGRAQLRFLSGAGARGLESSDWGAAIAFSTLGLILAGVGGPLLFIGAREVRRQRRVWRSGVPVQAVVTAVAPSSTWVNGVRQWEIRYAYTDPNGVKHKARSASMREEEARRWRVGDHGFALVDPQAGASSVWSGSEARTP